MCIQVKNISEKLTKVAETLKKGKKDSDPLHYSLVCVVWRIFTGKKKKTNHIFVVGTVNRDIIATALFQFLRNAFIPRHTELGCGRSVSIAPRNYKQTLYQQ